MPPASHAARWVELREPEFARSYGAIGALLGHDVSMADIHARVRGSVGCRGR